MILEGFAVLNSFHVSILFYSGNLQGEWHTEYFAVKTQDGSYYKESLHQRVVRVTAFRSFT